MRQAAEQTKIYENSLMIINKTIRKNELTIKQLETVPADRNVYVPLGRAYIYIYEDSWKEINKRPSMRLLEPAKNFKRIPKIWRKIWSTMERRLMKNIKSTKKLLKNSKRNSQNSNEQMILWIIILVFWIIILTFMFLSHQKSISSLEQKIDRTK